VGREEEGDDRGEGSLRQKQVKKIKPRLGQIRIDVKSRTTFTCARRWVEKKKWPEKGEKTLEQPPPVRKKLAHVAS